MMELALWKRKSFLIQLYPNSFDRGLFTVAVKDIIKQPMTFTKRETEDDDSDGGHDDEVDDDDCHGDNASCWWL